MFAIKNVGFLQKLNKSASIESQVKAVRLQDKLCEQNFYEGMKKKFEPVTRPIKDISEEVTWTMTENSIKTTKQ